MPRADKADVQRRRAGGHADGILAPLPLGELLLELHAVRAGPVVHLARSQHGFHGANGVFIEVWPADQFVGYGLGPAIDGQLS